MISGVEYFKKVPLFADLEEKYLCKVADLIKNRSFSKGQIVFFEGEPGEGLFIIKKGEVKISKLSADGKEQILHFLKEGDVFAEVVLFDGGSYPATAEVQTDSVLGVLTNSEMEGLLIKHPQIAIKLLRLMSRRLRQSQLLVRDLALHDSYSRLVNLLLRLSGKEGYQTEEGVIVEFNHTRQEIANMIGTTRETVARIFSKLRKEGIIKMDKQKIIILSLEKLKTWQGF